MRTARRPPPHKPTGEQTYSRADARADDGETARQAHHSTETRNSRPAPKASLSYMVESVLGFLLVSFSAFRFPSATSTELDASWQIALGYFLQKKLLAGVDYVFPYGPFGYFWSPNVTYYPPLATLHLCWWMVFSSSFAVFVLLCASRLSTRAARLGFVGTLAALCVAFSYEVLYFAYICSGVSLLFSPPRSLASGKRFAGLLVSVVIAFAFLSLTKLSIIIVSALGLASVCGYYCARRRYALAACTLFSYAAVSLTLWLLTGQGLTNIEDFVRTSLEVGAGYSSGMSLRVADYRAWFISLAVCSLVALLTAIKAWKADDKALPLFSGGFVVITLLLAMKGSFVRTFGLWFFGFAFCAPFFISASGPLTARKRLFYVSVFLLYEVTVVVGLLQLPAATGHKYVSTAERITAPWITHVGSNLEGLLFFRRKIDRLDETWKLAVQEASLPAVREYVGNQSIDLIPYEPARLILNGLNYRPRPAFQSYMAYTEQLQDLNLQFYRSASAPRFVLFRVATIDGRFPIGDDGKAIQYLFENYRPVMREDEHILFERSDAAQRREPPEKSLGVQTVPLNHALEAPRPKDSSVSVRVNLKKTFLGHVFETLHALPHVFLEIETEGGQQIAGKLVPGIGESGIMIAPLLISNVDWVDYFLGARVPAAKQLTIRLESPLGRWMYGDTAEVEFLVRSKTQPAVDPAVEKALSPRFNSFFSPQPVELKTLGGRPEVMRLEGKRVLFLHAPSWVHLPLETKGTYRLHAEFGIMPGAETNADPTLRTDGVVFSFRINDQILSEQELRPVERIEDRATASFTTEFRVTDPSTLVAEARIGASGNGNADWSYWKTITVERVGD